MRAAVRPRRGVSACIEVHDMRTTVSELLGVGMGEPGTPPRGSPSPPAWPAPPPLELVGPLAPPRLPLVLRVPQGLQQGQLSSLRHTMYVHTLCYL